MAPLPDLGELPPIAGIDRWFNTETPIARDDLQGSVTLLEFMTSSCINCIRTFPTLARWHGAYAPQGLVVIGIHTPEFAFEHDERVVEDALARYGLTFPVGMDNGYVTWRNYNNRYWPARYLFDQNGRLRHMHIGEGNYQETEAAIRDLLREAGAAFERGRLARDEEPSAPSTPETYFGHAKPGDLASPERVRRGDIQTYSVPEGLEPGAAAAEGRWRIEGEHAIAEGVDARIVIRFDAEEARAVIAPPEGSSATCRIRIDGSAVGKRVRGEDIVEKDGETYLVIDRPRSYRILKGRRTKGELEIVCLNRGTRVYSVTF